MIDKGKTRGKTMIDKWKTMIDNLVIINAR